MTATINKEKIIRTLILEGFNYRRKALRSRKISKDPTIAPLAKRYRLSEWEQFDKKADIFYEAVKIIKNR